MDNFDALPFTMHTQSLSIKSLTFYAMYTESEDISPCFLDLDYACKVLIEDEHMARRNSHVLNSAVSID